jgi:hypothetical protein
VARISCYKRAVAHLLDTRDVAAIDWSKLDGAYGASVGDHDVGAALRTLAEDHDVESDARNDALDCLVWSHGWHQGSIYEVTAAIVPFIVAWIERGHDVCGELAAGLEAIAASAHAPPESEYAPAIHAAFAACGDTVLAWPADRAQTIAIVCGTTPGLRERWLDTRAGARLAAIDYLAIAAGALPAWALARAREDVAAADFGAAALLAIHAGPPPELANAIEHALAPHARVRWGDVLDALALEVPKVRAPYTGDLVAGQVVFASPNMVLVRVGDRNITVRLHLDVAKGDAVRLGLSPHGELRALEIRGTRIEVP